MDSEGSSRPNQVNESIPFPPVSDEIWKMILDRSKIPEIMAHTSSGEIYYGFRRYKTNTN